MKKLGTKSAKRAVKKAAKPALKPVQQETKRLAPKGKTGRLAKGIKVKVLKRSRRYVGARVASKDQKSAWFEFGTKPRFTTSGRYTGRITKLGFQRKAADNKRAQALGIYKRRLAEEIIKEAKS